MEAYLVNVLAEIRDQLKELTNAITSLPALQMAAQAKAIDEMLDEETE